MFALGIIKLQLGIITRVTLRILRLRKYKGTSASPGQIPLKADPPGIRFSWVFCSTARFPARPLDRVEFHTLFEIFVVSIWIRLLTLKLGLGNLSKSHLIFFKNFLSFLQMSRKPLIKDSLCSGFQFFGLFSAILKVTARLPILKKNLIKQKSIPTKISALVFRSPSHSAVESTWNVAGSNWLFPLFSTWAPRRRMTPLFPLFWRWQSQKYFL